MKKEQEIIMEYKSFCSNYEPGTCIKSSFGDLIIAKEYCFLTNYKNKINYILDFDFPFDSYADTDEHPYEFDLKGLKLFLYMLKDEVNNKCIIYNLRDICKLNAWEWEDEFVAVKLVSIMNKLLHYQIVLNGFSDISIKNNDEDERLVFLAEVKKDRCVFQIKYDEDESKDITGSAGIIAFKFFDDYSEAKRKINELISSIDKAL